MIYTKRLSIDLNVNKQDNDIFLKVVSRINQEYDESYGDDLSHSNYKDHGTDDYVGEVLKALDGSKSIERDVVVTTVTVIENLENDSTKFNNMLNEEIQLHDEPYKIEISHDVLDDVEREVKMNMNLDDDGFDDYKYIESNQWDTSFDTITISNSTKNILDEEFSNNSKTYVDEVNQGIIDEDYFYNNINDYNNVKNHVEEEINLYRSSNANEDLIGKSISGFSNHDDTVENIDNHLTNLEKTNVNLNDTFLVDEGHILEVENAKIIKEKTSMNDSYDHLLITKDQIANVIPNILEKPHVTLNSSTNFEYFHFSRVQNNNVVESTINNENNVNIGLNDESIQNTQGNREVKEIVKSSKLTNDKNIDQLHIQLDQEDQVAPLEYFDGVLGKTNYYIAISPEIKENNYQLEIPNEILNDYVSFEPSCNIVEIENKVEFNENFSNNEHNNEKSLQSVDETKTHQNNFLDHGDRTNEIDGMKKQTKQPNINVEAYEIHNNKKFDDVDRKDEIKVKKYKIFK